MSYAEVHGGRRHDTDLEQNWPNCASRQLRPKWSSSTARCAASGLELANPGRSGQTPLSELSRMNPGWSRLFAGSQPGERVDVRGSVPPGPRHHACELV